MRVALVSIVCFAVVAAAAVAGFTPAWSYVSPTLRSQLAAKTGGPLYLPARTPLFYRYRSGATVSRGTLTVPFTNRVRIRAGLWHWTKDTFMWRAQRLSGDCASWRPVDKTLQVGGNKVFWTSTGTAWRCVRDARGRAFVLSAGDAAKLGDVGLAIVVASGVDVARRTTPLVALAVTPASVKRGGTVLVHGVAGGCTAGDHVTILSRVFAGTHSFAGVPAVFAQVGSAGRFSTRTRIPARRAPGRYGLTARCGGGNLGVSATLTVTA